MARRFVLLVCALVACKGKPGKTDAPVVASASVAPSSAKPDEAPADDIKPVYPLDVEPSPVAQRICAMIHELPEKRRAECCNRPASAPFHAGLCVRALSAALAAKAVAVDPARIDACEKALGEIHAGCEWVGPNAPSLPRACRALFSGKLPKGAKCRSNLECDGKRWCRGVAPTDAGTCADPKSEGEPCGATTDALAAYTRQELEDDHLECAGVCALRKCAPRVAEGARCSHSAQCGPDAGCASEKCVKSAGLPNEPCLSGRCEAGAGCVRGMCVPLKPAGSECAEASECLGGCLSKTGGAKKGVCGKVCE